MTKRTNRYQCFYCVLSLLSNQLSISSLRHPTTLEDNIVGAGISPRFCIRHNVVLLTPSSFANSSFRTNVKLLIENTPNLSNLKTSKLLLLLAKIISWNFFDTRNERSFYVLNDIPEYMRIYATTRGQISEGYILGSCKFKPDLFLFISCT